MPFFSGRKDTETGKPLELTGKDRKETYDYIKKLVTDDRLEDISMRSIGNLSDNIQDYKKAGQDWRKELDNVYYDKAEKSLMFDITQSFENLILGNT